MYLINSLQLVTSWTDSPFEVKEKFLRLIWNQEVWKKGGGDGDDADDNNDIIWFHRDDLLCAFIETNGWLITDIWFDLFPFLFYDVILLFFVENLRQQLRPRLRYYWFLVHSTIVNKCWIILELLWFLLILKKAILFSFNVLGELRSFSLVEL